MSEKEEIIVNEEVKENNDSNKGSVIGDSLKKYLGDLNGKAVKYGIIALGVLGLLVAWRMWWIPKRNEDAGAKLAKLFHYYNLDSMDFVLNGNKKGKLKLESAPSIAKSYWLTKKGEEAALMAATAYLKVGKYEDAISFFNRCNNSDETLKASILSGKAVCYSEMKEYEKAADLFYKAAEKGGNEFTASFYYKAGLHYEKAENYSKAIKSYTQLKEKYSNSGVQEAADIDKHIYRAKSLAGDMDKS